MTKTSGSRPPAWPIEAQGGQRPADVDYEFAAFAGPTHPGIKLGGFCRATWVKGRTAFERERDSYRTLQVKGHYGWVLIKEGFMVTPMMPPLRKGARPGNILPHG